jgi:hypothetical protein
LGELPYRLDLEFQARHRQQQKLLSLNLMSQVELYSALTKHTHIQPWAIYFSKNGGLNLPSLSQASSYGVIPCSSMQNHGVAWQQQLPGDLNVWLATAPKVGKSWDWDSDIGHESAHAAFAPIPLFAQALNTEKTVAISPFTTIKSIHELSSDHLARMSYTYSELSVVSIRGEHRPTQTGLPVVETPDELFAFLELSRQLMPGVGFEHALSACDKVAGIINTQEGEAIFAIATPVLRVVSRIANVIYAFAAPELSWYQN